MRIAAVSDGAGMAAAGADIAPLPRWILSAVGAGSDGAVFASGAALAHVVGLAGAEGVPQELWRARLAVVAAEACVALDGRREGAAALRDALHLARAGDDPGPAGTVLRQWTRAVARPVTAVGLGAAVEGLSPDRIALCLSAEGHPVERAAAVIEAVLTDRPRAEGAALLLADAVLARAVGQGHLLPLLGTAMVARDLRLRGEALRIACHRAVVAGAGKAVPLAADLARRAARLRAVAPRLRARGAGRAVEMFLTRDVVAPAALARDLPGGMTDRAARRLCDRLVGLGALREMTGRETFRLYGV